MTIELSKQQYVTLLKLSYLGQWMINSFRIDRIKEYDAVEQHLMSYAPQLKLNHLVEFAEDLSRWFPTKEMEMSMHERIDEYNEDFFFEELVYRLGRRDSRKSIGERYDSMSPEEKINADQPFLDRYYDELETNGLENLGIIGGGDGASGTTITEKAE